MDISRTTHTYIKRYNCRVNSLLDTLWIEGNIECQGFVGRQLPNSIQTQEKSGPDNNRSINSHGDWEETVIGDSD